MATATKSPAKGLTKKSILDTEGLITKVSEKSGETKACCKRVIDSYGEVVINELKNNIPKGYDTSVTIKLPGIGTMGVKRQPPIKGRMNHLTGKKMDIDERLVPTFKIARNVKVSLNEGILKKKK